METSRLKKEFAELYDGEPWIDVQLKQTLSEIPAAKAAKTIAEGRNSIWQILIHVIEWRRMLLKRLNGNVIPAPNDNFIHKVSDASEAAWKRTIEDLEETQQEWINFLDQLSDEDLEIIYPVNGKSYYYHIQGLIQHDVYHLGQIVLLSKLEY